MKLINRGWAKPGDEIAQPVGIVLGGNLRQNTEPKIKQPSPMQLEERERLVAEKAPSPQGYYRTDREGSGGLGGIETNPDHHEAEIAKHHNDWTGDTDGEAYLQWLVQGIGRDPTADLRRQRIIIFNNGSLEAEVLV
jgi:hypothetical protein